MRFPLTMPLYLSLYEGTCTYCCSELSYSHFTCQLHASTSSQTWSVSHPGFRCDFRVTQLDVFTWCNARRFDVNLVLPVLHGLYRHEGKATSASRLWPALATHLCWKGVDDTFFPRKHNVRRQEGYAYAPCCFAWLLLWHLKTLDRSPRYLVDVSQETRGNLLVLILDFCH